MRLTRRQRGRYPVFTGRPTFADDYKMSDDATIRFGDTGMLEWSTDDANANCLVTSLPAGGTVDVPVHVYGIGIKDTDLGFFNGVTQMTLAVVDADKDSYIKQDFSADDVARIAVGGSCAELGITAATTNIAAGTLATIYGAATRIGYDSGAYMSIAVADTTGAVTITHAGSSKAIGWTSTGGLTFTGAFEVVGATTLDSLTAVGDLSVDGATAIIDGSTSVRNVSAGFTSLEAPDIRFGFSNSIYTKFAVADTTGNLTITHAGGTTDAVSWTAAGGFTFTGAFEVVGASTLDGVTISGDIDSAGKADFDYSPPTGAANGHILKSTLTTATVYNGTTAGLSVKSYFADNACTVTGGEFTGLYVNVKQLAALTGGAKSSIISGHNYGSGGDYQSLDYGVVLYGDITAGFELTGGTSAYGIKMGNQTVSTADIELSSGMTIYNDKADRTMIGALIGIGNDNAPADNAPTGGVVLYFDGTDLKAVNSAGGTATLNNAAFS